MNHRNPEPDAVTFQDEPRSRRDFLRTSGSLAGGLLVAFALPGAAAKPVRSPASTNDFEPNAFIRIALDGTVTLTIPRVEMGQGTYTALPLLIAEELEVLPSAVRVEHAAADEKKYANPIVGFQVTGGSTSVRSAWMPLRRAGAAARMMLIEAAARAWSVPVETCTAKDGAVHHAPSGRELPFGQLVEAAAALPGPESPALKPASQFNLIGVPIHRLDGPDKVTGRARYGIDARPPGLLVAAIVNAPVIGATVMSIDARQAKRVQGVRQVVSVDNAVAVVADHYGAAKKAAALLRVQWSHSEANRYSTAAMRDELALASLADGAVARRQGDLPRATAADGVKVLQATYQQPLLAHACMEPVNCTVHVRDDSCELWLGTQVPSRAQAAAADVTGLPLDRIEVHNHLLGGGFGRRLEIDFVTQAVKIARQVKAPLKVIWSREEDTRNSTFRPYHFNRLTAALNADGLPTAWSHRVTGSSILARWYPERFQNGLDGDAVRDGAGPYDFPNLLVEYVRKEPPPGITTGFWRGVGHMQNAFPVECFLDELAHAGGQDPIAMRKALLAKHPRGQHVLDLVAKRAGWGTPLPSRRGRGVALTYCFGSYAAQVTQVVVDEAGQVRVERVWIAIDCGTTISPDTVVAQMEGGVAFGLTAVLFGEITLKEGRVEQGNFDTYRVLRMSEMPIVEVQLVASDAEPGGVGEVGTVLVAPSVVNAVFAATGKRIRDLPLSKMRPLLQEV